METLPDFQSLGAEQHFLTDYGDEETFTLPWDLFSEDSAIESISTARKCWLPLSALCYLLFKKYHADLVIY